MRILALISGLKRLQHSLKPLLHLLNLILIHRQPIPILPAQHILNPSLHLVSLLRQDIDISDGEGKHEVMQLLTRLHRLKRQQRSFTPLETYVPHDSRFSVSS